MTRGSDHLDALIRRGDERERFADCARQANDEMAKNGSDSLVAELRQAREDCRPIRLGTINTLILLRHIDELEAALGPVKKP